MHAFDVRLFHWINGWTDSLSGFFVFFSEGVKTLPVRLALVLFVALMMAAGRKTRSAIIQALIAWPLANEATNVLKSVFQEPRPCVELADVALRVGKLTSFGTASAHSANMAAVATVLVWRLGWRGSPWIAIALATGLSRIYVGVHYPSQVLLGWLSGVACACLVLKTWDLVAEKRSSVRKDSEPEHDADDKP